MLLHSPHYHIYSSSFASCFTIINAKNIYTPQLEMAKCRYLHQTQSGSTCWTENQLLSSIQSSNSLIRHWVLKQNNRNSPANTKEECCTCAKSRRTLPGKVVDRATRFLTLPILAKSSCPLRFYIGLAQGSIDIHADMKVFQSFLDGASQSVKSIFFKNVSGRLYSSSEQTFSSIFVIWSIN